MKICVLNIKKMFKEFQLDVSNSVYDQATETVFSTGEQFTLSALVNSGSNGFDAEEALQQMTKAVFMLLIWVITVFKNFPNFIHFLFFF